MMLWNLITGEYPPQPGGVSDYSRAVAHGLAAAGDEVHVWAPEVREAPAVSAAWPVPPGVHEHRLPGMFGPTAWRRISAAIAAQPTPRRVLLQYTPHVFGWKAMNIPFNLWLGRLARREAVWTMFHEAAVVTRYNWKHRVLSATTQWLARRTARVSQQVFLSTPAWLPLFESLGVRRTDFEWLPIPSNIATQADPAAVARVRGALTGGASSSAGGGGLPVVGHFGTYGPLVWQLLQPVLQATLREIPNVIVALVGRGSDDACRRLAGLPGAERLKHAQDLSFDEAAAWISACDVLLQPYPDGITCRRGSLLGGLALGRPIVSNFGHNTEAMWRDSPAVQIVPSASPAEFVAALRELLAQPALAERLGVEARALYERQFALEHTLARLRKS